MLFSDVLENGQIDGAPTKYDPLLQHDTTMSRDRQKFLILCIFDFSLSSLLWLLSTVTKGDNWPSIFLQEINFFEPHFLQKSLFDVVVVVFLRMIILLIAFAWLRMSKWYPVALTTTITTIYLIIKVLFFFHKDNGTLPQFLLILCAFVNAWIQLWLLPFRVLAHEREDVASIATPRTETSYVSRAAGGHTTEDEFRSALEFSSEEEDSDFNTFPGSQRISLRLPKSMKRECKDLVATSITRGQELIREVCTWKLLSSTPEIRYSDKLDSYYVKTEFSLTPEALFTAAWKDNPKWNTQLKSSVVLAKLGNGTELIRIISQPAMNGYISSREFIDVRHVIYSAEENSYFCVYASVSDTVGSTVQLCNTLVRGKNGVNVVKITPSPTSASENIQRAVFEFIMNTDVKGRIPKLAIRSTTKTFLQSYIGLLQRYVEHQT